MPLELGGQRWLWVVMMGLVLVPWAAAQQARQASIPQGTASVLRFFPQANAFTGSTFDVRLAVNLPLGAKTECLPAHPACNDYYIVEEFTPVNTTLTRLSAGQGCVVTSANPRIVCVVVRDTVPNYIDYTIRLPDTAQTITFSGHYMFQGDGPSTKPIGNYVYQYVAPNPNCPTWICEWGEWSNTSGSCGIRYRNCTDVNRCGVPYPNALNETTTCPPGPSLACGNGVIDTGEVCDGAALSGNTCGDVNSLYGGGTLGCLPTCVGYDTAGCRNKAGCIEDWKCDPWSACTNGVMTRTCADANACPTPVREPDAILTCTPSVTPYLWAVVGTVALIFLFLLIRPGRTRR